MEKLNSLTYLWGGGEEGAGIETFFFSSKELSPNPSLLPEDRLDPGQRNCCT